MWNLPGPGLEPVSLALAGGFLTTSPPGKPQFFFRSQALPDWKEEWLTTCCFLPGVWLYGHSHTLFGKGESEPRDKGLDYMIHFPCWGVNIISPAIAVTMHGDLRLSQKNICEMLKVLISTIILVIQKWLLKQLLAMWTRLGSQWRLKEHWSLRSDGMKQST